MTQKEIQTNDILLK